MGCPFVIEDGGERRYQRTLAIQKEVTDYLQSIDEARPYVQAGVPIKEIPKILPRPPILALVERIDRWGFPYPGTWLDQPYDLIMDYEAAQVAREIYRHKPKKDASVSRGTDPFADAPTFESVKAM